MSPRADRFDPNRQLPEIDPFAQAGNASGTSQGTGTASASEGTGFGAPQQVQAPWGRKSRASSYVKSIGSTGTQQQSAQPMAPSGFERIAFDREQQKKGPYEEGKKLKGKKAIKAYEAEQEAKRRRAEEEARRAADRESKGVAGFADRTSKVRGVSISNPDYVPTAIEGAIDAAPPKPPKPWYKKFAIMVPASIVLVAALAVGIGWPAYLQVQATNEANAAAEQYQRAMQAYEVAWSEDNLRSLIAAKPSTAISSVDNPLQQPADAQKNLDSQCSLLEEASRAATAMTQAPPPSVAQIAGGEFSSAYQDVLAQDASFERERASATALLDGIAVTMPQLQQFCTNFRLGVAIENASGIRDETELAPLRTFKQGAAMKFDKATVACPDAQGCPDLPNKDKAKQYSELWADIAEEHDTALSTHYAEQCWLDALTPYCVLMSSAWTTHKEDNGDVASALGSPKPNEAGPTPPLPDLDAARATQTKNYADAEHLAYLEAGKVDAAVLADDKPEWETSMVTRLLKSFEHHLSEGQAGYLDVAGSK